MRRELLDLLVDPIHGAALTFEGNTSGDSIDAGMLRGVDGSSYPIIGGIPRMVANHDAGQAQTSDSFGFKWTRRDSYDSPQVKADSATWLAQKYGFSSADDWARHLAARRRILDLGCGSGFSSSLWLETPYWDGAALWVGADISVAIDVAHERLGHLAGAHFVQADALQLPFAAGAFDTVFSEGVLHHTPSTRAALLGGARVLAPGGEFHFYVYRRKAPVREFTDDYVRAAIASLTDTEAWEAMRSLTQLGCALSELKATVRLEEGVPLLGIPAGEHDLQRLIYWHFAKLFWNPGWSFEENVHVNFDWYRPHYAHRQTEAEVRSWCDEAGLRITHFGAQESGFAVRAVKE